MKVMLALSRRGSARAAAQELGVSNSTVSRRLDELEHQLQTRLFDRTPDGYRLTAAGEDLLPAAEHAEELLLGAERRISGGDQQLHGSIRLTLPDVSGMGFLVRRLADFAREYPAIDLQLLASHDALDLSRREADIAIRVMSAGVRPPEYLIGRYLAPLSASTYVHRDLLREDRPDDLGHLTWIGKNAAGQGDAWLERAGHVELPVRHGIGNLNLLVEALRYRMGMAYLPCFAVSGEPDIVRVPGAPIQHESDMWVLTHKDLRLSARLRVLRELVADEFARIRPRLDTRPG